MLWAARSTYRWWGAPGVQVGDWVLLYWGGFCVSVGDAASCSIQLPCCWRWQPHVHTGHRRVILWLLRQGGHGVVSRQYLRMVGRAERAGEFAALFGWQL